MSYIEKLKADYEEKSALYQEVSEAERKVRAEYWELKEGVEIFEEIRKWLDYKFQYRSSKKLVDLKANVASTLKEMKAQKDSKELNSKYEESSRLEFSVRTECEPLEKLIKMAEKVGITSDIIELAYKASAHFDKDYDIRHNNKCARLAHSYTTPTNYDWKYIDFELEKDHSWFFSQYESYRKRKAEKVIYVGFKEKVLYLSVLDLENTGILKRWSIADGATEGKLETAKYKKATKVFILRKDEGVVPKDEIFENFFNALYISKE
jgi:hypothetical protein